MPEEVIDWSRRPLSHVAGLSSAATARTRQVGEVRLRIIEYAPGYVADHWCSKGHIIYVIAGEPLIDHQNDSPACALSAGMSWHVADDEGPAHRARSDRGATIFIVD
jgi:quercetin dioxygenase-like cupin family protein